MSENASTVEIKQQTPIDQQIAEVFERKANQKDNSLIRKEYQEKFQLLINSLAPEDRKRTMVKLQKIGITIRGAFAEYGARFADFVRNIVSWPMIAADPTFPKDKYYQMALARAKAWTGFAGDTRATATTERNALKKHFLPAALTGAGYGSMAGGVLSIAPAIVAGLQTGAQAGMVAGLEGAAVGAGVGALIGGVSSLAKRIKDRIIGPPVAYYDLDASASRVMVGAHASSNSGGVHSA